MNSIQTPRRLHLLLFSLLVLSAFCFHISALKNEFIVDDRQLIVEGKIPHSWQALSDIFRHSMWYAVDSGELSKHAPLDTYRPIPNVTFVIDRLLWGDESKGFHFTNLWIHSLCVGILFLTLSHFVSSSVAFFVSILFAIHPQTVEPAQYVSARTDSLAALMVLFSFYGLVRRKNPTAWALASASLFYFCALLSKEVALMFGASVPFICYTMNEDRKGFFWKCSLTYFVPTVLFFCLRGMFLNSSKVFLDANHAMEVMANHFGYFIYFVRSVLLPIPSSPSDSFPIFHSPITANGMVCSGLSVLGAVFLFLLTIRKHSRASSFLLWSAAALLPPLIAITVTELHGPRYFYTPFIAGSFAAALGIESLKDSLGPRLWWWVTATCVITFGIGGLFSMPTYRDNVAYYSAISSAHPELQMPHYNLGRAYALKGYWSEAEQEFRKSVEINKNNLSAVNNLAVSLLNQRKLEEAQILSSSLAQREPQNVRYLFNYGVTLFALGKTSEAKEVLARAYKIDPFYPPLLEWKARHPTK